MDDQPLARVIDALHETIRGHVAQLDALDEAIGDGDHGTNLARGFAAVATERGRIAALPLGPALQKIGALLEREVGGAGGTYYGLLFKAMGGAAPGVPPTPADLAAMLQAGIEAIQAKGGARKGEKTLLDVLIPVVAERPQPDRRRQHGPAGRPHRGRSGARPAPDHAYGGQARPRRRPRRGQRQPPRRRCLLLRAAVRRRGRGAGAEPAGRLRSPLRACGRPEQTVIRPRLVARGDCG